MLDVCLEHHEGNEQAIPMEAPPSLANVATDKDRSLTRRVGTVGWARGSMPMARGEKQLRTGKRKRHDLDKAWGLYHSLPKELQVKAIASVQVDSTR